MKKSEPKSTTPVEVTIHPNRRQRRSMDARRRTRGKALAKIEARIGVPEVEIETDGRFLADFTAVPGAMAYGATAAEAIKKARAIALEATAPRHVSIADKRRWNRHDREIEALK